MCSASSIGVSAHLLYMLEEGYPVAPLRAGVPRASAVCWASGEEPGLLPCLPRSRDVRDGLWGVPLGSIHPYVSCPSVPCLPLCSCSCMLPLLALPRSLLSSVLLCLRASSQPPSPGPNVGLPSLLLLLYPRTLVEHLSLSGMGLSPSHPYCHHIHYVLRQPHRIITGP